MKKWTTREGEELKIKKMSSTHISNCINYLKQNPITMVYGGPDVLDTIIDIDYELTNKYIKAFKKELKKRK